MPPRSRLDLLDASRSLQMLPGSLQMPPGCLPDASGCLPDLQKPCFPLNKQRFLRYPQNQSWRSSVASLVTPGLHLGTQRLPETSQRTSKVSNGPPKDTKMEAKIDEKSALGPSRAPLAPKRSTKPQNDAKRYPKSLQKVPKMTIKGTPDASRCLQ